MDLFSFVLSTQIPLPPMDERKKVVEDVDKDRRYAIDASIVRIMKSRKVLGYQQLITECVEQLSRMFKVWCLLFIMPLETALSSYIVWLVYASCEPVCGLCFVLNLVIHLGAVLFAGKFFYINLNIL